MRLDNRIRRIEERLRKLSDKKERDISKLYAGLLLEIQKILAEQYRRYETDGILTYVEMIKYDRLKKFEKELIELINNKDKEIRDEIMNHLADQYKESYYRTAHVIEMAAKVKLAYSAVKREVLYEAINIDFTGLTLNERLEKRRYELIIGMRETIVRGLHQGQSYRSMANLIKNQLEGDLFKARRIVRTEAHRIREKASLESVLHAHEQGVIMKKTWNSVQDERVRANHNRLDGVTIPADEKFKLGKYEAEAPGQFGYPEMDINCRCFLTYEIEAIEKPQHEELAGMSYEDWEKERLS